MIEAVVSPVLQAYVDAPDAVRTAEPPVQIDGLFTVTTMFGTTVTFVAVDVVAVQPIASDTVTVYEPALFTNKVLEVSLLIGEPARFHWYV